MSCLVFGTIPALALAADLSQYRGFKFGTDLPSIARRLGASPSEVKVIHGRPALIQELEWRPQSSQTESARDLVFSFYNGELYRILINYDRYDMEGLTAEDVVNAVSAMYGPAARPAAPLNPAEALYGDEEEVLARWQDPQFGFDLIRVSYGPGFRLIGALKRLDEPARAAILEAARLDEQEAPQRDAERVATEQQAERTKLEKARLANRPRFRP